MKPQVITALFLVCCLQGSLADVDRNAIRDQYTPNFVKIGDDLTTLEDSLDERVSSLTDHIKTSVATAKNALDERLDNVQSGITDALSQSITDKGKSCVDAQKKLLDGLSSDVVDICQTSPPSVNIDDVKKDIQSLLELCPNVIDYCETLSPIPNQDEGYLSCITHKIIDLEDQRNNVEVDFNILIEDVSRESAECISNHSSPIYITATNIQLQVSLCVALNPDV